MHFLKWRNLYNNGNQNRKNRERDNDNRISRGQLMKMNVKEDNIDDSKIVVES